MNRPRSLFDIWNLYQAQIQATQPAQQANATLAQTKTALLRYTLPGWGFPAPKRHKLTNSETEAGLAYTKQVSLEQLSEAPYIQQEVFEELQIPSNSQRNYRAALNKLLMWCEQQSWWRTAVPTEQRLSLPDKQNKSALDIRVTNRKYKDKQGRLLQEYKYGLGAVEGDVIPSSLLKELNAFKQFRINPNSSNLKQLVKKSTLDKDLKHIRLILGWLHRIKSVPLEKLSLERIVPLVHLKSNQDEKMAIAEAQEAAQQAFELASDYIKWLKASPEAEKPEARGRGIESPHTELSVLKTFLLVAEFIYHQENESNQREQYKGVSVVELLRQQLFAVQKEAKNQSCVSNKSKKRLDWTEFLAFVEQLRQECNPRFTGKGSSTKSDTSVGHIRPLSAIAYSYQCFLLAALISYIPPQRQQIYRNLRIPYPGATRQKFLISSNKQGKQEDKENLTLGLFLFHEDSNTEIQNEKYLPPPAGISGYLYQEASLWYIHLFPDEYKTGKNYEDLSIKVPNIQYSDGRFFYQYIKEWLFDYTYQDNRGIIKKIEGLRQVFHPQHEYFFTQEQGKRYSHPTNFSNLLRVPGYRITKKFIVPDSLREMFAQHVSRYSPSANTQIIADRLRELYKFCSEDYDVWISRNTVDLSQKIAEEISQNFVEKYRNGNASFE